MKRYQLYEEKKALAAAYRIPEGVHAYLEYMVFEKGEYLFYQDGPSSYLLFILKGKAKVSLSVSSGRTLLLCFYKDQGILGDVEMMSDSAASSTVQALTEMECIGIPYKMYEKELKADITFMNYIGSSLADKLYRLSMDSAWNQLVPVEERLCAYILMTEEQGVFHENLTETADLLGTSYRHLMRILAALCEQRVLRRKENGRYMLLDLEALERQAKDNYISETHLMSSP